MQPFPHALDPSLTLGQIGCNSLIVKSLLGVIGVGLGLVFGCGFRGQQGEPLLI
jgi:hypothetical protein